MQMTGSWARRPREPLEFSRKLFEGNSVDQQDVSQGTRLESTKSRDGGQWYESSAKGDGHWGDRILSTRAQRELDDEIIGGGVASNQDQQNALHAKAEKQAADYNHHLEKVGKIDPYNKWTLVGAGLTQIGSAEKILPAAAGAAAPPATAATTSPAATGP